MIDGDACCSSAVAGLLTFSNPPSPPSPPVPTSFSQGKTTHIEKRFPSRSSPSFLLLSVETTPSDYSTYNMSVTTQSTIASFGGKLLKLAHDSSVLGCESKFNLFLPPQAQKNKVPLLIWLSGLTCTGDNCAEKGFFQHGASKKGIAVLYPDTSPSM